MAGVVGIVGNKKNIINQLFGSLCSLQHRTYGGGPWQWGAVIFDGKEYWIYNQVGVISLGSLELKKNMKTGNFAIGKVCGCGSPIKGSTKGNSPVNVVGEDLFFVCDGSLNLIETLESLLKQGKDFIKVLLTLWELKMSFAVVIFYKKKIIGARDPYGIKPLCLGYTQTGFVLASESCAFSALGGKFIRDIQPGEIVILSEKGVEENCIWAPNPRLQLCFFELNNFCRSDSVIDGTSIYVYRKECGEILAKKDCREGIDADMVCPIPDFADSAISYSIGFAQISKIPLEPLLILNPYLMNSVLWRASSRILKPEIQPISLVVPVIREKKIVIITTSTSTIIGSIMKKLIEVGTKEIHLRLSSPPISSIPFPCPYNNLSFLWSDDKALKKTLNAAATVKYLSPLVVHERGKLCFSCLDL